MVLAILSNVGAYVITNALVVKTVSAKTGAEPVFYEANPVATKINKELASPPPSVFKEIVSSFLGHVAKFWIMGVCLGLYIFIRHQAKKSWKHTLILCIGVSVWWTQIFFDFANDLGYLIGKIIF